MLVLDANILIRAVLGSNALALLDKYVGSVNFVVPDTAFQEAKEHIPRILAGRRLAVAPSRL